MRAQTGVPSALLTCDVNPPLRTVLELFAVAGGRAERVVCIDDARRVTGIITLSDVFAYFCRGSEVAAEIAAGADAAMDGGGSTGSIPSLIGAR